MVDSRQAAPGCSDVASLLKCAHVFQNLSRTRLKTLAEMAVVQWIKGGEFLLQQGEEADLYYVILRGKVRLLKHSRYGKDFVLRVMHAGETLGDVVLFGADKVLSPISAQAVDDTLAVVFKRKDFVSFVVENPAMAIGLNQTLARRLEITGDIITELLADRAELRVIKVLIMLNYEFGQIIPLPHYRIAEMAGITRETTSRVLGHLRRDGIIRLMRNRIEILNRDRLSVLS